jgi:hypothetical protein
MFHRVKKTSRDLPTQVLNVRGKRVITPGDWVDLLDFVRVRAHLVDDNAQLQRLTLKALPTDKGGRLYAATVFQC